MPAGRPTLYNDLMPEQAYRLALLGLTDEEMASALGVDPSTFDLWKAKYPEFLGSINEGKESADAKVAEKLYRRALGYSHDAVKIFMPQGADHPVYAPYIEHYPPDTQAASLWLRNRQPKKWRDKTDVNQTVSGEITNRIEVVCVRPPGRDT